MFHLRHSFSVAIKVLGLVFYSGFHYNNPVEWDRRQKGKAVHSIVGGINK